MNSNIIACECEHMHKHYKRINNKSKKEKIILFDKFRGKFKLSGFFHPEICGTYAQPRAK